MAFRPQAFSIPSSTELKITFNQNISKNLSIDNFKIESLSGSVDDLKVLSLNIENNVVVVKTNPQVAGNYYIVHLVDDVIPFSSEKGDILINDNVSRDLFFVGIEKVNPIRDRIFEKIPGLFNLQNSNIKNILSAQAEEIYTAQKKIGELLSDNYLSIDVVDEFRTRSSGATDRLANEQAYEILRVSENPSFANLNNKTINYNSKNVYSRLQSIPRDPISLQESIVDVEEISISSEFNFFKDLKITTRNRNILKVLSILVVREDEVEDCEGNIGTFYNIEKYKYTIKDNKYDSEYALTLNSLNDNEILLSEFGNITSLNSNDKVYVTYLFKDLKQNIDFSTLDIYDIRNVSAESVPSNSTRFFVKNAPIINKNGTIPTKNGIKFYINENNLTTPPEFKKELVFDISRLPKEPGEFSVNYNTGEVFLVGTDDREGTARNNYICQYNYKKTYEENLDYFVSDNDVVFNTDRFLLNKNAFIDFKYENIFVNDLDYKFKSHIEVLGEAVENRVSQPFALETKNSPITNVYRIYNETTGEVYNYLYKTDKEIFFSGNRSPEIKIENDEQAVFYDVTNEKLNISEVGYSNIFSFNIISAVSFNSIQFSPSIPAEGISEVSNDYFIFNDSQETNVRFFGDPDSNNLIDSLTISSGSTLPTVNTVYTLGLKIFKISLDNINILNKDKNAIGSLLNSSVSFSRADLFKNEKYFKSDLQNLRIVGDYSIDYINGIIYLAIDANQNSDLGFVNYSYNKIDTKYKNILSTIKLEKKLKSSVFEYDASNTDKDIFIKNLESSLIFFDENILAPDLDGNLQPICEVLSDYTVVVPYNISKVFVINNADDVLSLNLNATDINDRVFEKNVDLLKTTITNGGYNIYENNKIVKNVIDLKNNVNRKFYLNSNNEFELTINDSNISQIYSVSINNSIIFDNSLNITKESNLKILNTTPSGPNYIVDVISSNINNIISDNYILDKNKNRFKIINVNTLTSQLTVESPAENNSLFLAPEIDINGSSSSIIVRAETTYSSDKLIITIPIDAPISSSILYTISYLKNSTPSIGTALAIEYSYGNIYASYNYVYDNIKVWYEYGDNEIDWSISNTLLEGQNYYVTYKYGANREALRNNFGAITQVPLLQEFPLNFDREIYRDAVSTVLQSFPKGPTINTFEQIGETFTDIKPEIKETRFDEWNLNKDYLNPKNIKYKGNLNFTNGVFNSALEFSNDTFVNIPTDSSISINEGTLECWIAPNWAGISNDASITFNINNIGKETFILNKKPFDNGWNALSNNNNGIFDFNKENRISNYDIVDNVIVTDTTGIYKTINGLNRITDLDLSFKYYVSEFGQKLNNIYLENVTINNSDLKISEVSIDDNSKKVGIEYNLNIAKDEFNQNISYVISSINVDQDTINNFNQPYPTRSCNCRESKISNKNINELVIIFDLNNVLNLSDTLNNKNVIDNNPEVFVISMSNGDLYQIIGFEYLGKQYFDSIPNFADKIIAARLPLNDNILVKNNEEINAELTGSFVLYYKNINVSGNHSYFEFNNYSEFVINWSKSNKFRIKREPLNNLVYLHINNNIYKYFYTNFNTVNNVSGIYFTSLKDTLSSIKFENIKIDFYNRFDVKDIYIGSLGYNPKNKIFTLNRKNINDNGISDLININEGIFIGFDESCISPLTNESGQWVFRTRVLEEVSVPVDVVVMSPGNYENIADIVSIEHKFSGSILTDGEFGSVIRSRKDNLGDCTFSDSDYSFRFCGSGLLEEGGWRQLSSTESDLINILGGRESNKFSWRKNGSATSTLSNGIYRLSGSETELLVEIPSISGVKEIISSARISSYDTYAKTLDSITVDFTGISVIELGGYFNLSISLAKTTLGQSIVLISENEQVVDIISYEWDNNLFNEYKLMISNENRYMFYINNMLLSSATLTGIENAESYLAIILSDNLNVSNIVDFDFISLYMREQEELNIISDDIFINTDSKIEFEFNFEQDGYVDGYTDGYSYVTEKFDENEIIFSSDALHYIVDSGVTADKERLSLFKDGKGFLNFRIFAKSENRGEEHSIYNLATNIKHFLPGEWHHVACSWKIGSVEQRDEMHLFVDGYEVPNLYKFGGKLPIALNTRYSDISKEILQSIFENKIVYPDRYTDGSVSAGTSLFNSPSITFTEDMIGKSIVVYDAPLAQDLIGKELIIKGVTTGNAILGTGKNLDTVKFLTSDLNIEFSFAPYSDNVLTDVKNNKIAIYREDILGGIEELGGIFYKIENDTISILTDNVSNPKYRVNVDSKYIEFIGKNEDCAYLPSVSEFDTNINIQTFGLNTEICNKKFNLSSSSYMVDNQKFSGQSVIYLFGKEPIDLSDVKIKRIILDKTLLDISMSGNFSIFSINLDPYVSRVSSDSADVFKNNLGRYLSVVIDSDNINFCNDMFDGYGQTENVITVYGETVDGSNFEEFYITKNGAHKGTKLFKKVDRVEGSLSVLDEDYFELGVLSIEESDFINIGNNGGEELEIFDYASGYFVLTVKGSNGTYPFELHPGAYSIEYSTYLTINLHNLGDRLYIGSDLNEENIFDGSIDEFRIVSEKYLDTKITEESVSNLSVTKDYLNPNEFCPDETTLTLIHFNDPREHQIRRLKKIEFLDEENNVKYKLTLEQLEELFKYLNNENMFIQQMLYYGFSLDESEKTYIEAHKAEGGPLWDDAYYIENYDKYGISKDSVNSQFNHSALFKNNSGLILDNTSYLRNNEGTIEFWVSPLIDTKVDDKDRFYFDAFNGKRVFKKIANPKIIDLDLPARKILSVKLTNTRKENSIFSTYNDTIFDEITRSDISGRLEGGTGVEKDFSIGHVLIDGGKRIILKEALPSGATGVVVTYIPLDSNGDRIYILKNKDGQLVFGITANNIDNVIKTAIDWKRNSWHKIKCVYKTNTLGQDFLNIFVDGVDLGVIKYGTGLIYGTGLVYGQMISNLGKPNVIDYRIPLTDSLSKISIGSDVFGMDSANARIDNFRISYKVRSGTKDASGLFIDQNYSENLNTVSPLIKDDLTTLLLDFDSSKTIIDNFINVLDDTSGLYNFIINIDDSFRKINSDETIEDLLEDLVNIIKPAHSNAFVKFRRNKC